MSAVNSRAPVFGTLPFVGVPRVTVEPVVGGEELYVKVTFGLLIAVGCSLLATLMMPVPIIETTRSISD